MILRPWGSVVAPRHDSLGRNRRDVGENPIRLLDSNLSASWAVRLLKGAAEIMVKCRVAGAVAPSRIPFRKIGPSLFRTLALRWRTPPPSVHRTAAALLLSMLLASMIAQPSPAHASGEEAGVVWEADLTVGNLLLFPDNNVWFPRPGEPRNGEGTEIERGFRRISHQCIGNFFDDIPGLSEEDQSLYDYCYGELSNRMITLNGQTYELEGLFAHTRDYGDTLEIPFKRTNNLEALAGYEFVIDGVVFRVADANMYWTLREGKLWWSGISWPWEVGEDQLTVQFRKTPALSAVDVTVTEGTDATADFTVTLDPPAYGEVTVDYATSDGTATAGADYTGTAGTLTFSEGESSKTVSVPIIDDSVEDGGETFTLTLSNPGGGATLARGTATGTIDNDETDETAAPPLTASLAEVPSGHGGEPFTLEVTFSEAFAVSWLTMRDHAFAVTGGRVTGARRVDNPHHEADGMEPNRVWRVTVEPGAGAGEVTVSLPAATDCEAAGAVCTEDGRGLSAAVSAKVPRDAPSDTPAVPFTVSLENMPAEHDGAGRVTFRVVFSRKPDPGYSYRTMRDETLAVTQGGQPLDVIQARRLNRPHNDRWEIEVDPVSRDDMTVSIGATTNCAATGAICTADGEKLASGASATIPGPPGLSVADAGAEEGPGVTVDFAVTLGRESASTVTVDYATSDGTATAGSDYTRTSGTLTFAPGETAKTVSVPVLDDAHDEGGETFTLTLSNPTGGNAWLEDAEAAGTIRNTDPMPGAWIARFGRTVAEQVIGAVEGRLSAPRAPGVSVTLAGRAIGGPGPVPGDGAMAEWLRGMAEEDAWPQSRGLTSRQMLTGSSFALTGGAPGEGHGAVWGRGAATGFDGRADGLTLDGEVESAMIGADFARGRMTAGVALAHSRGDGTYRGPGTGAVEGTLTGLYPYGRWEADGGLTLWGVAGLGRGELALTPEGDAAMRADLELAMGALGVRGTVLEAPAEGGLELAAKADAMAVRTASEGMAGLMAAEAETTRLRLALEGTWRGLEAGGGVLAPTLEAGLRHDGGDAETGFGLDLGGGLAWSDPARGLSAELRMRGLLTHESEGFRERGVSGSVAWDPGRGSGRGPALRLTQALGDTTGGSDALFGRRHLGGLAADDAGADGGSGLENRRLELRMGYGLAVLEDRFTLTPEFAFGRSGDRREYALGWRLNRAHGGRGAMEFRLEATRSEAAGAHVDDGAEHGLGLGFTARW